MGRPLPGVSIHSHANTGGWPQQGFRSQGSSGSQVRGRPLWDSHSMRDEVLISWRVSPVPRALPLPAAASAEDGTHAPLRAGGAASSSQGADDTAQDLQARPGGEGERRVGRGVGGEESAMKHGNERWGHTTGWGAGRQPGAYH